MAPENTEVQRLVGTVPASVVAVVAVAAVAAVRLRLVLAFQTPKVQARASGQMP